MVKRFPVLIRLLPLFLFALAFTARTVPGPRTIDDSYITFRYSRNILAGNGFTYNPGEHVLGTTTPLYAILLTGIALPWGAAQAPFPLIALLVNALADGITTVLLFSTGRRLGSTIAGLGAALVWAIAPFSVTFAIGGLETSVYVMLLTCAVYAHLRRRHKTTALISGLALLTRPDAVLLLGPLAVDRLWSTWSEARRQDRFSLAGILQKLWPELAVFLLTAIPWFFFASLYYGSPIPHSVAAKSLVYRLPPEAALVRLLQHYATPFLEHLTIGSVAIAIGLVLYPFLYLIGARQSWRADRHCWPMLVYPWAYFAAFALANPLIFRWYLTPPLPFYFLTILIGLQHVTADLLRIRRNAAAGELNTNGGFSFTAKKVGLVTLVIFLPLLLSLRDWQLHPDHGSSRPAPKMAWYQLELLYRQAASYLQPEINARADRTPTLAAGDVGVLGFYTSARILDTVGLNSPVSLHYYPLDPRYYVINYAIPPDLILDQQPDFIVILEVYGRAGLLPDPRFKEDYQLIKKIPTDIYGSDGMLIFSKKNPLAGNTG